MKKFFYSLAAVVSNFFLLSAAHAVTMTISTSVPGMSASANSSPGAYVAGIYQFALMIGGVLAFGVIVYGGVRYMASAGNPSGQSDAKEWIEAALLGLLLLVGAYFILNVVNPQLTNLTMPTLQPVNIAATAGCGSTTCPSGYVPTAKTSGDSTSCVCQNANGDQGCGGSVAGSSGSNSCGAQTCCPIQAKLTDPITYGCFANCNQAPSFGSSPGVALPAPCGNSGLTCSPATQRCCTTNYLLFQSYSCEPLTTSC